MSDFRGLTYDRICDKADELRPQFDEMLHGTKNYRKHGMLPSELLFLWAAFEELGLKKIVESGRFEGFSTEVMSKFYADEFVSVELVRDPMAKKVEQRFERARNGVYPEGTRVRPGEVDLRYGDGSKLLPGLVDELTMAVIDGPKGEAQFKLAQECLNKGAGLVALHDMNPAKPEGGGLLLRSRAPFLWSAHPRFVKAHMDLDTDAWKKRWTYRSRRRDGPFLCRGKRSEIYGPTVALVQGRG